jgi:hypothetical protein
MVDLGFITHCYHVKYISEQRLQSEAEVLTSARLLEAEMVSMR